MRATWAVYKRELATYFRSPIAYGVAFSLYLFVGLLFTANIVEAVRYNTDPQVQQMGGGIPATFLLNATQLITFLMFLIGPLLTMRLLSQENREGTLEMLMTLPMSESAFIVGKFLAVWTYYTLLLALSLSQVALIAWVGVPDYGVVFTSYLGAWLYGGAVLALSLIWSAVTEDQIVAAFLGAATVLVLYLSDLGAVYIENVTAASTNPNTARITEWLSTFFREIGLSAHYQTALSAGFIRLEDIAYFVLVIIGALFITTRIVEIRRWRS